MGHGNSRLGQRGPNVVTGGVLVKANVEGVVPNEGTNQEHACARQEVVGHVERGNRSTVPAVKPGGGQTTSVSPTSRSFCTDSTDTWLPRLPSPEHGTTSRLDISPESDLLSLPSTVLDVLLLL